MTNTSVTPTQACQLHVGDMVYNKGAVDGITEGAFGNLRISFLDGSTITVGKTVLMYVEDAPEYIGCECEIDWRCPLHHGQPTFLETRFQGMDEDEAIAHGVWHREFGGAR